MEPGDFGRTTVAGTERDNPLTPATTTVTFDAGATDGATETITVGTTADTILDPDETFQVTLSAPAGGGLDAPTLGTATATATIRDLTTGAVHIPLDRSGDSPAPLGGTSDVRGQSVPIRVRLTVCTAIPVEVGYDLTPGTAMEGVHYTVPTAPVIFEADEACDPSREKTLSVPTIAPTSELSQGIKTFTITLREPTGGFPSEFGTSLTVPDTPDRPASTTGTILDRSWISIWEPVSYASEGETAEFTVGLWPRPIPHDVTLEYAVTVGSGEGHADAADFGDPLADIGTVTIPAGDRTAPIAIPVRQDDMAETDESFTVTLRVPGRQFGTIPSEAFPDERVAEVAFLDGTLASSTGTILDAGRVEVEIVGGRAPEGEPVRFTVTLSAPPGDDVTLQYMTEVATGDTAVAADFTSTTETVTFEAGTTELSRTFTVPTTDDDAAEGDETFSVSYVPDTLPPNVFVDAAGETARGTIEASDAASVVSVSPSVVNVVEGGTVEFTVTLSDPVGETVTVVHAAMLGTATEDDFASGPAGFAAASGTLTFAPGAALTRTIAIVTADDDVPEAGPPETFTMTLRAPTAGLPTDVVLGRATATGTVQDVDTTTVSLDDTEAPAGDPFTFTVRQSNPFDDEFVLVWTTGSCDPAGGNGAAVETGELSFAPDDPLMQTFSVPPPRGGGQGSGSLTVTLCPPDGEDLPEGVTLGRATATWRVTDAPGSGARASRIDEAILPHVAQAMTASTVSAISGRIAAATDGSSGSAGKSSLLQALKSNGHGLEDGTTDLARALGGWFFVVSLNAAENDAPAGAGDVTVWGAGDYRGLSGRDDSAISWDGDLSGFHLGADMRMRSDLLAGVAVSHFRGAFGYTDRTDREPVQGAYDSRMPGVHPYASWSPSGGPALWATVGYGQGEIAIAEKGGNRHRSDTDMWTAAAGASHELASDDGLIAGGTAKLRLKGDGSAARIEVEGGSVRPAEYDVRRLRVALEGAWECVGAGSGGCLAPSLEAGLRHDGGAARTGAGVEVAGGLRWTDRAAGLTVEGRGRALVLDGDGYEDWGVGGLIRLDPGAAGRGPSFRLAPGFGEASRDAGRLYDRGVFGVAAGGDAPAGRLETEIGYGFAAPAGTVTPYTGLSLAGEGARRWRAGLRFRAGTTLGVSLEGTRRESGAADPGHGVAVRGRLAW